MEQIILGAADKQLYYRNSGLPAPLGVHLIGQRAEYNLIGVSECVPNIQVAFEVNFPNYNRPPGLVYLYIRQSNNLDDLPPNKVGEVWSLRPGWETLVSIFDGGLTIEGSTTVLKTMCLPTKKYLAGQLIAVTSDYDYGVYNFIGTYEVMIKAVYDQLMKGKAELDKTLAVITRQKTQLQAEITEGDAKATAILNGAYQLYSNFLSGEIAQYEALNP